MKKYLILCLSIITLVIGCLQNNHLNKYPILASQKIDTSKIAILQIPKRESIAWETKGVLAATLSENELKQTEAILNAAIASIHKNSLDSNWLSRYKRQYIPFINEKGEKLVWVNCFCDGFGEFKDWKIEIAETDQVRDGGDCFIKVTINLTENSFFKLGTHGYA